jgi:uncharacterized protein (TIGR02421 family)
LVRVLEAVRWDDAVEEAFFAAGCAGLPPVGRDWYRDRPLPFAPAAKRAELAALQKDVSSRLGKGCAAGRILTRTCGELRGVVEMLACRGRPGFSRLSRQLYGSSTRSDGAGFLEAAGRLAVQGEITPPPNTEATPLTPNPCSPPAGEGEGGKRGGGVASRCLSAEQAGRMLADRLNAYFPDGPPVRVHLSAAILADAAAEGGCLKLRDDACFSPQEVLLLEVHEGWVHLGTTRDGLRQPVCTFLAKGSPAATRTQEGLAVLAELLAGASSPARLRRLANRARAVALAEAGADFLDVFRFFQDQGCAPRECYQHTARVFRGSLPAGCGPFTKDLAYTNGFLAVCRSLRQAPDDGGRRIALLFAGKTAVEELPELAELADAGLLLPAAQTPPPFADPAALAARLRCLP